MLGFVGGFAIGLLVGVVGTILYIKRKFNKAMSRSDF